MPIDLNPGQVMRLDVEMVPIYVPPDPATLHGRVTITGTNQGIAGVKVYLQGAVGTLATQTATDGSYQIDNIEPGTYTVVFRHDDYEDVVI